MTEYDDMTLFEYSNADWALDKGFPFILHNVGWIGNEVKSSEPELSGKELKSLLYNLGEFIKYPVNLYRGHHDCRVCGFTTYDGSHSGEQQGNGEIFVKGMNNIVYVAPTMILHYVESHGYVPPAGFIKAVCNVPSMEFYSMFHSLYKNSDRTDIENGWWARMKNFL